MGLGSHVVIIAHINVCQDKLLDAETHFGLELFMPELSPTMEEAANLVICIYCCVYILVVVHVYMYGFVVYTYLLILLFTFTYYIYVCIYCIYTIYKYIIYYIYIYILYYINILYILYIYIYIYFICIFYLCTSFIVEIMNINQLCCNKFARLFVYLLAYIVFKLLYNKA